MLNILSSLIMRAEETGNCQAVSKWCYVVAVLVIICFNNWYQSKFDIGWARSLLLTCLDYGLGVGWMYVLCWAETGFTSWGGINNVRGFIWYPIIVLPFCLLFKVKWKTCCDYMAPCPCFVQTVVHTGCMFVGCCRGYPSSWGVYNPEIKGIVFPVTVFENITALIIGLYIVWRQKKNNYKVDGLAYPIMLMLFGSTRFVWEFFRDNEKLFWGISDLALHALAMTIVGAVAYVLVKRRNEKDSGTEKPAAAKA